MFRYLGSFMRHIGIIRGCLYLIFHYLSPVKHSLLSLREVGFTPPRKKKKLY